VRLIALALAAGALAAAPFKATLQAPGHAPKIRTKWWYTVRATKGAKPAAGRITVQIVDPLGEAHAVDYDGTKKPIVNRPFAGTFRDYVIWPADSREVMLKLRVTVRVGATKKVLQYGVTPRA
jgi:hypothetical protein